MPCRKCGSEQQAEYGSEINVYSPVHDNLDKDALLLFPKLLVCLKCGFTEFTLSESELPLLSDRARH
jgi:predicted nucleic-acid-binding Zn-ribbon protein